ncbi:MAG TPA: dienelactone hydrolase family protein [Longimicrobiales bacterium]|nr:dienelactone hydrolase family protein [Longimicrobiales bacterium]
MKHSHVLPTPLALAAVLAAAGGATAQADFPIPPDAEGALATLNASPRHGDWLTVRMPNGDSVRSWIVYPERSDPAPVVVVVHEIYGLTHWVRSVADRLAAEGFLAVAPDMVTMQNVPRSADGDPERDPAVAAVRALDADAVHRQIRAVAEHVMAMPMASDVYGIVGYCWGGSTSFEHAARYPDLGGAVVYYGSSPDEAALANVRTRVLGLYGSDDARVNATIPRAQETIPGRYNAEIFDGAGHGFLRQLTGREGANRAAAEKAWPMTVGFFFGALR